MASCEILSEFCAICQEEFPSSRSDLDLTRPESCETHWFHRECLKQALTYKRACPIPICGRQCKAIVDQSGNKETVENPVIPLLSIVDDHSEESENDSDLDEYFTEQLLNMLGRVCQGSCDLCQDLILFDLFCFNLPCGHKFHHHCLVFINNSLGGYECSARSCRRRVAATIRFPENIVIQYDGSLVSHPEYYYLQQRLGLSSAPAIVSNPCSLCGEVGPGKPRVLPPNCPGSHIVHRECLESRVDITSVCRCPVEGCQRQFMLSSLVDIPAARPERQSQNAPSNQPRSRLCCKCKRALESDIARPNNCKHLFHRECLVRATNHLRSCPVRGCKKPFKRIL